MKLTGKLKEHDEQAETREEAKKVIGEAGISLTDEELDQVSGGTWKSINDCPPGTVEVTDDIFTNEGRHLNICPNCDSSREYLEDKFFFFAKYGELCEGQECHYCNAKWIVKGVRE